MRCAPVGGREGLADAGDAETNDLGSTAADDGDGVLDLSAVVLGELVQVALHAVDEAADVGDLRVGGHGFGLGPFVGAQGGGQAFPVAQ
jgi:hypothetical protein